VLAPFADDGRAGAVDQGDLVELALGADLLDGADAGIN